MNNSLNSQTDSLFSVTGFAVHKLKKNVDWLERDQKKAARMICGLENMSYSERLIKHNLFSCYIGQSFFFLHGFCQYRICRAS